VLFCYQGLHFEVHMLFTVMRMHSTGVFQFLESVRQHVHQKWQYRLNDAGRVEKQNNM
jgi:hypothetical protein